MLVLAEQHNFISKLFVGMVREMHLHNGEVHTGDQYYALEWDWLVLVLEGHCIRAERTSHNNSFSENISLWEGVVVLKGKYIEQVTITVLGEKDFTAWEALLNSSLITTPKFGMGKLVYTYPDMSIQ